MVCPALPWSAWQMSKSRRLGSGFGLRFKTQVLSSPATSASRSTWRPRTCPKTLAGLICLLLWAFWRPAGRSMAHASKTTNLLESCPCLGPCGRSGVLWSWAWLCTNRSKHTPWYCHPEVLKKPRWSLMRGFTERVICAMWQINFV